MFPKSTPSLDVNVCAPTGMPSITYRGCDLEDTSAPLLIEGIAVVPRIFTITEEVGSLLRLVRFTPLTLPSNDFRTFGLAALTKSSELTTLTEYPNDFFCLTMPREVTTTSFKEEPSGSNVMSRFVRSPTFTVAVLYPI